MYINICKDIIIKLEDIVGIFEIGQNSKKENIDFMNRLSENKKITDLSDGNIKSLILYTKDGEECGILSNISSSSLGKKKKIIN